MRGRACPFCSRHGAVSPPKTCVSASQMAFVSFRHDPTKRPRRHHCGVAGVLCLRGLTAPAPLPVGPTDPTLSPAAVGALALRVSGAHDAVLYYVVTVRICAGMAGFLRHDQAQTQGLVGRCRACRFRDLAIQHSWKHFPRT